MASAYSDEQIDRYLAFISLPQKYHRKANPPRDLQLLTALHTYQLSTIPYENLSLHYSPERKISLDPQHLYKKFIAANGRGGYCMENSIFYNHLLRGLGFQVYTAGVRIRERIIGVPSGDYIGWRHIVNVVTLHPTGAKYMVDVGFGGDGATKPIPMARNLPIIVRNIGTQDIRLLYDTIPQLVANHNAITAATHNNGKNHPSIENNDDDQSSNDSGKLWIYQYRNGPDLPWNSFYCFPEVEFLPEDFDVVNYYVSTHPISFQTFTVLVIKFLKGGAVGKGGVAEQVHRKQVCKENGEKGGKDIEQVANKGSKEYGEEKVVEGEETIYGKRMLVNDVVKENLGGKTRVVRVLRGEEERVKALEDSFGIRLTREEIEGIKGRVVELKGKGETGK